ncbi:MULTISPECIES: hypothetical protein [Brevibacillus]|uniref:Ribbon-helix-helix protein CopG domain-containing protein n=1 Tax=Brevibacillus brevis TaxID=1393 RepID=A0ABY9TFY7_BREBE|nr:MULTISPECIES: hypothetical protein [Brevibacillus]MBG9568459.1 hypothetical protein [Brevibacillus agri]WNC17908.1 hypothetical protein RGB73_30530 [Brevibacillus brevis]
MSQTPVKIDDHRHAKMKDIAAKKNRTIQDVYREAIDNYLANQNQEMMLADSLVERILNERLSKAENRLAAMVGRTGMDVSILLMALMPMLEKAYGKPQKDIFNDVRQIAAQYYSRPLRDQ